jgi:hypothetical protein
MNQLARLTVSRDEVVPPSRRLDGIWDAQNAICQRVPAMMIEKKPTVEFEITQSLLYMIDLHAKAILCGIELG